MEGRKGNLYERGKGSGKRRLVVQGCMMGRGALYCPRTRPQPCAHAARRRYRDREDRGGEGVAGICPCSQLGGTTETSRVARMSALEAEAVGIEIPGALVHGISSENDIAS